MAVINPRASKDVDETQQVTFVAMASASEDGHLLTSESRVLSETKKGFTYFDKNDVLLAKITTCFENGKCLRPGQIATDIGLGSTEFHVIRPDPETLDGLYLFYLVWSEQSRFFGENSMSGAAGQKRIGSDFLKGFEIPLPPLLEQKRIATILDKTDVIRRKRQQAIQLADDFLRAVFLDMFGDPVTNPKGWKVSLLISLVTGAFQNGAYFPKENYAEDGVEMVHMADAFYDVIQRGSLKRVLASGAEVAKYGLTHEDMLISRRSLNYEGAAKPSLIPQSSEPLIFESSMIRITPDKNKIVIRFLFQYLSDPLAKDHFIRKFVTGATIKGISQKSLEQVRVVVPPLDLQDKFTAIVNKLEVLIEKQRADSSSEMLKALSQKAFSGQL